MCYASSLAVFFVQNILDVVHTAISFKTLEVVVIFIFWGPWSQINSREKEEE